MKPIDENRPILTDWSFKNFTDGKIDLKLTFKNPLYVSFNEPDLINIQVRNVNFFQEAAYNNTIANNYTL